MIVAALVLALAATAAPADLSGKWEGKVTMETPDGKREDTALLILTQKGDTVSGTVGESESDQHPITSGTTDGNTLVLLAKNANNGREYRIELTVSGDELKGTIASGERRGEVYAKKRKE
jgi:hypothetical protein